MILSVRRFVRMFTEWASQREDIRAVMLIGSQARATATVSSDVDLIVLARHPSVYVDDPEWLTAFGRPQRTAVEPDGRLTLLRVWYEHGLDVEFRFTDETWPLDPAAREFIVDGMTILLDRGPLVDHYSGGGAG